MPVALLSRNLLTASKVAAATRPAGLELRVLRAVDGLAGESWQAVLIDLAERDLDVEAIVAALGESPPLLIAFGPHVDTERLESASRAGCDHVLAQGQLASALPQLLAECG